MNILEEIRRQPLWARELMFGLSVVSTVALVGALWFDSFQKDIYALSNPGERLEDQPFYAQSRSRFSPVALVGEGFSGLRAGIYSLLNIGDGSEDDTGIVSEAVYPMPLARDRTQ